MNGKTLHGLLAATLVFLLWIGAGWAREPAGKSAQAPASITFEGGPGDSLQTAVVIKGAPDHMAGVAAEYQYLENTFGRPQADWRLLKQSLIRRQGRAYDLMQIELSNGARKEIYFDLSDFFGKF